MTILVDMDDTIENLGLAWVEYLNRKYDKNVIWNDIRNWDMQLAYPSLTNVQIYGALEDENLWDAVTVKEDAPHYLKKLIDEKNDVFIVTAAWYKTILPKVEKCLFKYFPFLKWEQVIVTTNKHLIKGDILVDDNPQNFIGGDYFGILFTAPHNLDFDDTDADLIRVDNWKSAYLIIQSYKDAMKSTGDVDDKVL